MKARETLSPLRIVMMIIITALFYAVAGHSLYVDRPVVTGR